MPSPRLPLLLLLCASLFGACATNSSQRVPAPDPGSPVAAEKARVYVARKGKLIGSMRAVRVFDGENEVGVLAQNGYLCWDRQATRGFGKAVFEGYVLDGGPVERVFDLPREGRTTTWFLVDLERGDRRPVIETLSRADGEAMLAARRQARAD